MNNRTTRLTLRGVNSRVSARRDNEDVWTLTGNGVIGTATAGGADAVHDIIVTAPASTMDLSKYRPRITQFRSTYSPSNIL